MKFSKRIFAALFVTFAIAGAAVAQQATSADISAQASNVTEFDVNGLKVILRRRASAPTVAAGLFLRGGVRNLTAKTAGLESLMLTSAIEAGQNFPRQAVRRELARTGSTLAASAGSDFSVVSMASTRENFDRTWKLFTMSQ
jgi:predicted Zn-dependent peptidase